MSQDVQIVFEIPTDSIQSHNTGTFDQPFGIGHPNLRVIRNGQPGGAQPGDQPPASGVLNGDTPIWIPQDSDVLIWCEDSLGRANVAVAIVRVSLHTWNGSGLDTQTMNSDDAPVGVAEFSTRHEGMSGLEYVDHNASDWVASQPPFWSGVNASKDSQVAQPRVFHPHVTFSTNNNPGDLTYGVEFSLLVDGEMHGYFRFDPTIHIMS